MRALALPDRAPYRAKLPNYARSSLEILGEQLHRPGRSQLEEVLFGSLVAGADAGLGEPGGDLAAEVLARVGEHGDLDANAQVAVGVIELLHADREVKA